MGAKHVGKLNCGLFNLSIIFPPKKKRRAHSPPSYIFNLSIATLILDNLPGVAVSVHISQRHHVNALR